LFRSVQNACGDESPFVRKVAAQGLCKILAILWDVLSDDAKEKAFSNLLGKCMLDLT
jgi:hypothetical protein